MPKRAAPLTAVRIANLKPDPSKTIEIADGLCVGLWHRLSPTGARSWSLSIRDNAGVRRRYHLGGNLSLSEARQKAEEMRLRVRAGEDPTAERKAARDRAAGQGFGALVDMYFEEGPGATHRTKREQLLRIRSVFADYLDTPAELLTTAQLQIAADRFPTKGSGAGAVKYLSPLLKWAHKRSYIPTLITLEKPRDPRPTKQRFLDEAELRKVLPHLKGSIYGRACKFALLTAVRLSELTGARWVEFDLEAGLWVIPGERRKDTRHGAGRYEAKQPDHVIPMPRQALEILREIRAEREAVIPVYGPIEGNELVFVGRQGAALGNWDRNLKVLRTLSGVDDWSAHALRRTCSTAAGDLGFPPHVISAVLGHRTLAMEGTGGVIAGSSLQGRYNKSRYGREHAEALQAVADYLDGLEGGAGKIIPMRKM